MTPLKFCPFCTKTDYLHTVTGRMSLWWVECWQCGAAGPSKDTADEAVAAWNTRAPESEIERMLVVMRDRFKRGLLDLQYIPASDRSGHHPHGYSLLRLPDWEARQLIDQINEALNAKDAPPKEGGESK